MTSSPCPLCLSPVIVGSETLHQREYLTCAECDLVYVPKRFHLSEEDERTRYLQHHNSVKDQGYLRHLCKALEPLLVMLSSNASGLDFGCGPNPVISQLMKERGFVVQNYDPYFAADVSLLDKQYDFIVCTEVAEHFRDPQKDFARLDSMLRTDAILALMTQLKTPNVPLADWWYARDKTHICFFAPRTLLWIAKKFNWKLEQSDSQVHIFRKIASVSTVSYVR